MSKLYPIRILFKVWQSSDDNTYEHIISVVRIPRDGYKLYGQENIKQVDTNFKLHDVMTKALSTQSGKIGPYSWEWLDYDSMPNV